MLGSLAQEVGAHPENHGDGRAWVGGELAEGVEELAALRGVGTDRPGLLELVDDDEQPAAVVVDAADEVGEHVDLVPRGLPECATRELLHRVLTGPQGDDGPRGAAGQHVTTQRSKESRPQRRGLPRPGRSDEGEQSSGREARYQLGDEALAAGVPPRVLDVVGGQAPPRAPRGVGRLEHRRGVLEERDVVRELRPRAGQLDRRCSGGSRPRPRPCAWRVRERRRRPRRGPPPASRPSGVPPPASRRRRRQGARSRPRSPERGAPRGARGR